MHFYVFITCFVVLFVCYSAVYLFSLLNKLKIEANLSLLSHFLLGQKLNWKAVNLYAIDLLRSTHTMTAGKELPGCMRPPDIV